MKKIALVTGGSRGIGFGIALALAKSGYDLAVNGVRPESAAAASIQQLRDQGAGVIYCQGDIGVAADRANMIRSIKDHYGRLNVLVNNAGVAPKERRDTLETTEESFDFVLSTNLKGTYFLTQLAANWMAAQKKSAGSFSGCIINISSISATVVSINRGEYCISKAGLSMMTQLFAVRMAEFDIPVYEIRPGVIDTDMTAGARAKYDKLIAEGLCVQRRWGLPEDVGKAVTGLLSGNFPYSTGQVIMVDGGLTIPRL